MDGVKKHMGTVIAIANQKGGVGKTTTCINLAACLAIAGKRVLAVDIDPQGNTSSGLGVDKNNLKHTIYELLLGGCYLEQATYDTRVDNLRVLPANVDLAGAEIELVEYTNREYILKAALADVRFLYDYIIIDCPPALNMLTINALTAADGVLVPMQCEFYALEGLSQLMHTVGLVQKRLNPSLILEGILFTMYDGRTNLSAQVVEEVKKHMGKYVFTNMVPRNVRLSEAPSHGLPIALYDGRSRGAESYKQLAREIMEKHPTLGDKES